MELTRFPTNNESSYLVGTHKKIWDKTHISVALFMVDKTTLPRDHRQFPILRSYRWCSEKTLLRPLRS
jgi:hypothetical protein